VAAAGSMRRSNDIMRLGNGKVQPAAARHEMEMHLSLHRETYWLKVPPVVLVYTGTVPRV
jgi:hypothetical protein